MSDLADSVADPSVAASRGLHVAAGMLATAVLADSAIEHYRGSFENPAMIAPLLASIAALVANLRARATPDRIERRADTTTPPRRDVEAAALATRATIAAHATVAPHATVASGAPTRCVTPRRLAHAAAIAVGAGGTLFHVYNVGKRPGGFCWLNLFYAAPIGAPAALSLAGAIGLLADRVADRDGEPLRDGRPSHDREPSPSRNRGALRNSTSSRDGIPQSVGRALVALVGVGLAGTSGEIALLHFRGAFHDPFMWLPLALAPIASAQMLRVAASSDRPRRRPRRLWLALTGLVGLVGVGFHAFGVSRAMGGWRNWSQNFVDGPPLAAPPALLALALAGRCALSLVE